MRVCVIGAGAAGLGCAYHLVKRGINHVVYEQNNCVGGTWVYTDEIDVHSSMYRDLRTNLPIEIMGYPGFPFPQNDESFVHHSTVLSYLREFFKELVAPHSKVSFNSEVINAYRKDGSWVVEVLTAEKHLTREVFSHVIVCTGKYSVPRIPVIKGAETFSGDFEHSHNYRIARKYASKRVLVVGTGFSGVDIALEVSKVAHSCFLSRRSGDALPLQTSSIVQKKNILHISGKEVHFEDSTVEVDCIIFCTGYKIEFPFLKNIIEIDNGYEVRDLYRHCMCINQPNLALIGLPSFIVPLTVFDFQIRWILAIFCEELELPSVEHMRKSCEKERKERNLLGKGDPKYTHNMQGARMWEYLDTFVKDGLGEVDPFVKRGYEAAHEARLNNLASYRDGLLKF